MMDIGGDNPVTLIVKAPNQRIADQTVDCFLEWTVRKLKEHLENVYPSKPKHSLQKLIYSGKLLQDHVTLKDVLRQMDEASLHTVHLVCASGGDMNQSADDQGDSVPVSPVSSAHSLSSSDSSEGLRYRGTPVPGMEQFQFGENMMAMPSMTPPYGYSPEQYLWMQQMYAQYMTQYMQYYNNAYQTPPATTPAAAAATEGRPVNQNQPNNNVPAAQGGGNQNMRMNAQGGMMEEDDDEDLEHRDWLDYIYILFRFLVLLSIVYFYSSFSRFVAVFTGFFIIYLLQKGWLNLQRNQNVQQQQQQQEARGVQPEQEQQQAPEQQQQEDEQEQPQEDSDDVDNQAATDASESTSTEQTSQEVEQPKPGVIGMVWCFFSTFFTSLVPQQPPAVNAN